MSNFDTSWYCPTCEGFVCANGDRRCRSCGNQVTTLSLIQAEIDQRERDLGLVDGITSVYRASYARTMEEDSVAIKRPVMLENEPFDPEPFDLKDLEDNLPVFDMTVLHDNWKHRSKGMVCKTCMYYVAKVDDARAQELPVGRCR